MKSSFRIDHAFLRLIFGRRWREKVWASKSDIAQLQAQIIVATTPFLCDFDDVQRVKLSLDTPNPVFNPGLLKLQEGYLVAVRSPAEYVFNDRFSIKNLDAPCSVNYLVWLDEHFNVTKKEILDESILIEGSSVWTPPVEDIRLFYWGGEVWGIAAIFDRGAAKVEQVIFQLNGNKIVQYRVLHSPSNQRVEKNWVPIGLNNALKIIYSIEPLRILTMNSPAQALDTLEAQGSASVVNSYPYRGGSPPIPYAGGYLAVVHSAPMEYQGARLYKHHFVFFTKELQLVEIGKPFFLEHAGIEIVSGLVAQDGGVLISYGVGDRLSRFLKIPDAIIEKFISCE